MAPTAASITVNAAAISVVVVALSKDVPLAALVLLGVYFGTFEAFFAPSIGLTDVTLLAAFNTAVVAGALAGALLGLILVFVLNSSTRAPLSLHIGGDDSKDVSFLERIPFSLLSIIGALVLITGIAALVVSGASSTAGWVAVVFGVLLFIGALVATGVVLRNYVFVVYVFIVFVVAGAPAAVYDYVSTSSRLGAAGVVFFVVIVVYSLGAFIGYLARRNSDEFATSPTRTAVSWIALLFVVTSLYLIGAIVDDSQAVTGAPGNAAPVAASLWLVFWAWIVVGACCFCVLGVVQSQRRRDEGVKKRLDEEIGDTTTVSSSGAPMGRSRSGNEMARRRAAALGPLTNKRP